MKRKRKVKLEERKLDSCRKEREKMEGNLKRWKFRKTLKGSKHIQNKTKRKQN